MNESPRYKKNVVIANHMMASTVITVKEYADKGVHARLFPLTRAGFEDAKRVMTESLEEFLTKTWNQFEEDNVTNGFN